MENRQYEVLQLVDDEAATAVVRKQLGDAAYHSVEKFDVRNSVFVMEQIYRTYLDIPGSPMADPSGAKRDTYAVKG